MVFDRAIKGNPIKNLTGMMWYVSISFALKSAFTIK